MNERYIMALYYAYGRADERRDWERPEPIQFAEHYAALHDDMASGRSSHCPSVQDAWDRYRRSLAS
jgi:hypothetical protein